jgi:hypothetical protein
MIVQSELMPPAKLMCVPPCGLIYISPSFDFMLSLWPHRTQRRHRTQLKCDKGWVLVDGKGVAFDGIVVCSALVSFDGGICFPGLCLGMVA